MSDIKSIALIDIHIPKDRLRKVKPEFVSLFALMLKKGRKLNPIKVRITPNGECKYTLVAGLHRYEGHQEAGLEEALAIVTKADKQQALEEEIEENLFRNELTALERIDAVAEYRNIFEERFGKVKPSGGDRRSVEFQKCQDGTFEMDGQKVNLLGLVEDSQQGNFYGLVTERLNLSVRTAKRQCAIAKRLDKSLHDALVGSSAEDNQSQIERLSKATPVNQRKLAKLIVEKTNGDVNTAEAILFTPPKTDNKQKHQNAVFNNIGALAKKDRRHTLQVLFQSYGADVEWALKNPLEAKK
ncbi:MAG: ParB N-terminal domain-containing protein [Rhizobiaceae bacterium]